MRYSTLLPRGIVCTLALWLALAGGLSIPALLAQESFVATHFGLLEGNEEVPPVSNAGAGLAIMRFDVDNSTLEYRVTVVLLPGDSIVAAHFHRGAQGVNGPPVHVINFVPGRWTATGTWSSISVEDLQELGMGNIYVNVHTNRNQQGQLRAQVVPIPNLSAQQLQPEQEVPPVSNSEGTGTAGLWLDLSANRAFYHVEWDSLSSTPTMAHFHRGALGVAGPPVFTIPLPNPAGIKGAVNGVWENLTAQDIADLRSGRFYVNIHTSNHQPGEIRGQIYSNEVFTSAISAANEVPPVAGSQMVGTGMALIQGDGQLTGVWMIGRDPANNAHIHAGAVGVNGDVVYDLLGLGGQLWFRLPDGAPISQAHWDAFRASGMYVNFHTQSVPTGEARGQLIPAANNLPPLPSSVPSLEPGTISASLAAFYDPAGVMHFNVTGAGRDASVTVYSALGERIASGRVTNGRASLETGNLPAGVYFAQLVVNGIPSGFSRVAVVR